jgi:NADH:ubiquinone oxidoreductase subunit E
VKTAEKSIQPAARAAVQAAVARHGAEHEALIAVLSDVNRALGFLSPEALAEVGRALNEPFSRVHSVATFYTLLSTQPRGRHVVQFCESAPCHVVGGRQVWQALQAELGLEPGETTPDGRFTLITTSCLGICGVGPLVVIDDEVHGNLTAEQIPGLLARYACPSAGTGKDEA